MKLMKEDFKKMMVILNEIYKERIQELRKYNMNQNNIIKEWMNKLEILVNRIYIVENRRVLNFFVVRVKEKDFQSKVIRGEEDMEDS